MDLEIKLLYSLAKGYRGKRNEGSYSVKDKNNNLLVDEEEIAERWKEYFSDQLNVEDNEANLNNDPDENDVEMEKNEDPITEHEVRTAIQKMKRGKSPGEDELPVEILKAGGDDTIQQLTRLFNLVYRREVAPLDWQRGLISPIRKKGDVTVCDNHRALLYLRTLERFIQEHWKPEQGHALQRF